MFITLLLINTPIHRTFFLGKMLNLYFFDPIFECYVQLIWEKRKLNNLETQIGSTLKGVGYKKNSTWEAKASGPVMERRWGGLGADGLEHDEAQQLK